MKLRKAIASIKKKKSGKRWHQSTIINAYPKSPKSNNSKRFSMIRNSSPDLPDLPEVSHLLRFATSSTRAGGQDDVSSDKLPQIKKQSAGNKYRDISDRRRGNRQQETV